MERLWPRFGVDFSSAPVDLNAVFGRGADRVLEIGFGDGETLVDQAAQNPAVDYLGVEVHRPGIGHCLLKADARGIGNLRDICHDAVEVLGQQIADQSFSRVNLYFPDPWPKKRHHKRRLMQADFLDLVASKLIPGGALHVATDWRNYSETTAAADSGQWPTILGIAGRGASVALMSQISPKRLHWRVRRLARRQGPRSNVSHRYIRDSA
jgi:tRNA (guanine-N7-)-methyltransferase